MSISTQENALLDEWHESRRKESGGNEVAFVRDGMVDEDGYTKSNPKIAYVLKEYAPAGRGNDLRSDLHDGVGYWWGKVDYMTHSIRRLRDTPGLPTDPDSKRLREMRLSICAFNLSKIGGNTSTDMQLLALQAMKRREFIQRQFALYDPGLTICCGTFNVFRYALAHDEMKVNEGKHINWYERSPGKFVIDTYHFAYPAFGYTMIDNVVNEIKGFFK
ncbi:hypothetical protein [Candidatus Spongiihabitans sp.]|uniref:hypothetical protein n=1 Tax=Candidatus Spongiihabitans sp. TaxID=3101308 RepID=UPI003C7CCB63